MPATVGTVAAVAKAVKIAPNSDAQCPTPAPHVGLLMYVAIHASVAPASPAPMAITADGENSHDSKSRPADALDRRFWWPSHQIHTTPAAQAKSPQAATRA